MYYNTKLIQNLKPSLVASYDIRPGNGGGLFWFRRFINLSLTYLLRHLPTYLQPWDPHRAWFRGNTWRKGETCKSLVLQYGMSWDHKTGKYK